jgi:predicted N-acetyltransferase YhbS
LIRDREVGISGAISFWPLKIGGRGADALLLGPLAVHPARQNLGIGLALMREGLARATAMGHGLVILVGDLPYYARAGFAQLPENHLLLPGPADPRRFLYLELVPGALAQAQGLVLPPHRFAEISAALAVPHGADRQQQRAEA